MSKYLDSVGLEELWGIIKSTFAASISIDGRTISLKNKSGNTLGSTITIPSTATSLATTGTVQIDLASTSSVTYTSGGNITPGVKGTLKVANGGTGITSNPSMLVNLASTTADTIFKASPRPGITGTLGVGNGGTGQTSAKNAANAFINALDVGNTVPGRNDYIIAQYTNGGTTTTTYYRKTVTQLFKALNSSDIITALGYEPPIEKELVNGSDSFSRPLMTTIRPNKLVLLPADQIIIEQTTDGGSTWVDAGYTDNQKRMLFLGTTSGHLIKIPLLNGVRSKLCGIRITITAMKYNVPSGTEETSKYNYWNSSYIKSQERYCSLRELYVWCYAFNDKLSMKVEYASGEQSTNWITAVDVKNLIGWSGGNVVNWFTDKTFGGSTSQTKNYWNWRMTFFTDGLNGGDLSTTSTTQQQSVSRICGYGSSAWTAPNYLMAHDHLYTWDFNQNATFPAQITATKFNGEATSATTANKWASEQTVYVTLGTASKTTTIQGGSSTAQTIGVDGVLGVANGGTGLTASPSMLTNLGSTSAANVFQASPRPGVTGTLSVGNGGTGQTSAKNAANAFINALDAETTALQDGDYFIAQTAGGGTTTTTYKRKPLSSLATYVEDKISNNLLSEYAMMTKKADMAIPANSDLNTYTTPGYFICDKNDTAKSISNNPTRLFNSSGDVTGAYAFALVVMKVTDTTFHQFVYMHQPSNTSERARVPSSWQRYFNGSAWTNWFKISSVLSNPYPTTVPTSIDFEASEQGLGGMFHFVASDTNKGSLYQMSNVLQMNWSADTGYDSQLAVGYTGRWLGFRSRAASGGWNPWNYAQFIHYGVCNSAADAQIKEVDFGNCSIDIPGTEVTVKFVNGNTHTKPKLATSNISPTATFSAGVDIFYKGAYVDSTYIKPNDVVRMVWDGTRWNIVGSINSVTSYGNHIRYYINRESGSDTNDGLTTNTPFKTIEKFLEVTANAGYTDCRCTILKDGAYVLNKQALNNVTLHIKVDSSVNGNVILQGNYNVPEDWIMYNAHVKLTGTANAPIVYEPYSTQGIYFENSAVALDYVKFNCRMQCFGCYVKADNVTAERLHLSGCTGYLATVSITNTDHEQHGIVLDRGCNMRISGALTINALTTDVPSGTTYQDKNYFMNIQDSDIVLQSSFPTTLVNGSSTIDITNDTNRARYSYAYGMRLSNAEITGTRIRLASYVSRGVNKTMLADEESDINVTWGGKSGDVSNGRAGFNSLYGLESIVLNTDATDLVSANAIKTWTIPKSTIVSAVASVHPNVGTSAYPYKILAVVPVSTSDNRVIIKNSTVDSTTGDITVVGRNVTSSNLQNLGIFATVSILYTMSPFSITYRS